MFRAYLIQKKSFIIGMFRKRITILVSFDTGRNGMKDHKNFIDNLDKNGGRIIHAYTFYHDYSSSHKPATLNYVVEYNRRKYKQFPTRN